MYKAGQQKNLRTVQCLNSFAGNLRQGHLYAHSGVPAPRQGGHDGVRRSAGPEGDVHRGGPGLRGRPQLLRVCAERVSARFDIVILKVGLQITDTSVPGMGKVG